MIEPSQSTPETLTDAESSPAEHSWVSHIAKILGPLLAFGVYQLLAYEGKLEHPARATAALATLMAIWWMTEAIPLAITSLLPLVLLPLCAVYGSGKAAFMQAAIGFSDPSIFLFLGGFLLALSLEKWGLHKRIALFTLSLVGTSPRGILLGFLLATAFLSMWISNSATTAMMLPIALSVAALTKSPTMKAVSERDQHNFVASLILGVAYAASIGGSATLIGTPTNTYFRGFMAGKNMPISFIHWTLFALPVAIAYIIACYFLFTRFVFPVKFQEIADGKEFISNETKKLGPLQYGEKWVLVIFSLTALAWLLHDPLAWLMGEIAQRTLAANQTYLSVLAASAQTFFTRTDDTVIALLAAVMLFLIPIDLSKGIFILDWQSTHKLPWDSLLIFGGGLSLSEALKQTGFDIYLGDKLENIFVLPLPILIAVLCLGIIFFSELTSNVATIATLAPIIWQLAKKQELDPLLLLVPSAMACSYAFMLPAGTPPNALAYATGQVKLRDMLWAGFWLNLLGGIALPVATYTLGKFLGIQFR